MGDTKQYNSVQEYYDAQTEHTKQALLELKEYILIAAPNATEVLNYNIPAFTLIENGNRAHQIMIAGYKNAVGFYPHPSTMKKFESELIAYKTGKGSVQFPLSKPLPKDLIIRMVRYRAELLKN